MNNDARQCRNRAAAFSKESFAWLSKEIASGGGETTLRESSFVGGTSNEAVEALFHTARGFQISDAAVSAIAEMVHDIDVRDGKFGRAETPGIERLVNGIALTQPDDEARVVLGSQLFDALYQAGRRKRS
jgi:hypothetical protein